MMMDSMDCIELPPRQADGAYIPFRTSSASHHLQPTASRVLPPFFSPRERISLQEHTATTKLDSPLSSPLSTPIMSSLPPPPSDDDVVLDPLVNPEGPPISGTSWWIIAKYLFNGLMISSATVAESSDTSEGGKLKMILQLVKRSLGVKDIAAMFVPRLLGCYSLVLTPDTCYAVAL